MIYETFREAVKNIWSNKFRTVLTMLGIIIGVTAVIVIVGLGNGMTQSIKDSFSEMGTNVLSVQITGRAEALYPLTLVEDSQGVWLGHTDPEVIPLTLEAGELVDVTLHMVDNWGRESTQGSSISFLARAQ